MNNEHQHIQKQKYEYKVMNITMNMYTIVYSSCTILYTCVFVAVHVSFICKHEKRYAHGHNSNSWKEDGFWCYFATSEKSQIFAIYFHKNVHFRENDGLTKIIAKTLTKIFVLENIFAKICIRHLNILPLLVLAVTSWPSYPVTKKRII
jgi:hypothetical protein